MYDSDIVFYQCPKIYDTLACSDGSDKCKGDIDKVDIVTLALHEVGHFFGFAHVWKDGYLMNPHTIKKGVVMHEFDTEITDVFLSIYSSGGITPTESTSALIQPSPEPTTDKVVAKPAKEEEAVPEEAEARVRMTFF